MPPRLVTAAILLFWLTTTGWLLYREVWPAFQNGEPPPYTVDLLEQVGANAVSWNILQKGERIGLGFSKVQRGEGQTFELTTQFKFDRLTLFNLITLKKAEGTYRVTEDGQLLALSGVAIGTLGRPDDLGTPEGKLEFRADIEDQQLVPELRTFYAGQELKLIELERVPVSEHGSVLNPMHPLNRLPGLRVGQRWKIPLFNPITALLRHTLGQLAVQDPALSELQAEVVAGTFDWDGQEVPCHTIEYREPGKAEVAARTWARRRDGLVLQQEAYHGGYEIVLQRVPEK